MDEATLERAIAAALRHQTDVAMAVDLWPRVRKALPAARARRRRHRGRRASVVLVVAGLLIAASGAVSASGAARSRIGQIVGIRGGGLRGGPAPQVEPSPDFRVLGPAYLPQGLDVEQISYSPGDRPGRSGWVIGTYTAGRAQPSPASSPNLVRLPAVARQGVPFVYVRYSSSSGPGFVEVVQTRARPGTPLSSGETVMAGPVEASLTEQDGVTTVTLVESGTHVDVATNLGRTEAIAVAASLHT